MAGRITQKSVAKAAKVHPSTVCLALNNSASLPEETRKRICEIADKLGYRRDPMLGALAVYRRTQSAMAFHGVLGWIVSSAGGYNWRLAPEFRDYYHGASERAQSLGYRLEILDLHDYRDKPQRLNGVLRARNIRGVLVCPQPNAQTALQMEVEDLSAVTFGYSVEKPALHMVTAHHYAAMRQIIHKLRLRGYRRIGYAIPAEHNARLDQSYMAAFLIEQQLWPKQERVMPFTQQPRLEPFRSWLRAEEPDCLISTHYGFPDLLDSLKVRAPKDLGVAIVSLAENVKRYTGIDEDSREIGRVAAGLVASMVERGERGVPARPQRVLVRGIWREGATIAALQAATA
jgi:LacI family transcriptional regulator/LacI family repressor for deo operon, udp, cdd, tsx, nupC, and nupG